MNGKNVFKTKLNFEVKGTCSRRSEENGRECSSKRLPIKISHSFNQTTSKPFKIIIIIIIVDYILIIIIMYLSSVIHHHHFIQFQLL